MRGMWAKWLWNRRHADCGASIVFKLVTEFLHATHKNYMEKTCLGCIPLKADASGLLKSNAHEVSNAHLVNQVTEIVPF